MSKSRGGRAKTWRWQVLARGDYTCQKCRRRSLGGEGLKAHHIKSWSEFPELRFVLSNGITLCYDCEDKEHHRSNRKADKKKPRSPSEVSTDSGNLVQKLLRQRSIIVKRKGSIDSFADWLNYEVSRAKLTGKPFFLEVYRQPFPIKENVAQESRSCQRERLFSGQVTCEGDVKDFVARLGQEATLAGSTKKYFFVEIFWRPPATEGG